MTETMKPNPKGSTLGQLSREHALRDIHWVAEYLGVSTSWVYQASASGRLPCVRVGALVRFNPVVIKAWAKGEQVPAKAVRLPSCR